MPVSMWLSTRVLFPSWSSSDATYCSTFHPNGTTTVLVLVCILSSSTQFTYFTLPCLFLQDQHKAEETVHPKIPLHFILSQTHTHVVRLFTELHLPPNTQVLEQGGRQGALQCPVQCSTRPPPSPQLYLLALLSLPRHARTQQGLVKL